MYVYVYVDVHRFLFLNVHVLNLKQAFVQLRPSILVLNQDFCSDIFVLKLYFCSNILDGNLFKQKLSSNILVLNDFIQFCVSMQRYIVQTCFKQQFSSNMLVD